jgi:hypothetical protein
MHLELSVKSSSVTVLKADCLLRKNHALEIGAALVGIQVEEDEWMIIREQIHASPLKGYNKDLEDFANQVAIFKQDLKRQIELFQKGDWRCSED